MYYFAHSVREKMLYTATAQLLCFSQYLYGRGREPYVPRQKIINCAPFKNHSLGFGVIFSRNPSNDKSFSSCLKYTSCTVNLITFCSSKLRVFCCTSFLQLVLLKFSLFRSMFASRFDPEKPDFHDFYACQFFQF